MALRNIQAKGVYKSDRDNILEDFYFPALSAAVRYDRAVGFFSSSTITYAAQALSTFTANGGRMRLIVGAFTDARDIAAIKRGEDQKRISEEIGEQFLAAIEEARAHGDLSENAEYHAAKERQGQVEAQIAELEDKTSRAQIIDPATLSGDKVVFGATVTVLDEDDKPLKYQIVGQAESDAKRGRISYESPLARALIGKSVGEEVEVTVPSGEKFYLIEKIEFI